MRLQPVEMYQDLCSNHQVFAASSFTHKVNMQSKPVFFVLDVIFCVYFFIRNFSLQHKPFKMRYYLDCMSTSCSVTIKYKSSVVYL